VTRPRKRRRRSAILNHDMTGFIEGNRRADDEPASGQ
jgi:hypothetical protein